ncbi:MAG: hypothetical protein COB39_09740 [Marinosulfonomonas sp.]|nr:MAG: hypothetical protein COB39_09740 [Marinosulfonomonas sp.]
MAEFAAVHPMNTPQGQGMGGMQGMQGMGGMQGAVPFAVFDLNGDGGVSRAEFDQARANNQAAAGGLGRNQANAPAFEAIDANGDGTITQAEFMEHQAGNMRQRPRMGQGLGGKPGSN